MSAASKGRILYCEDHDDTRVLMTMMLEEAGFQVTSVGNATDCLDAAWGGGFDIYLLDHTFPDASGVTILRALREFDKGTPVLFYSARAMPQEREEAMREGAQDYLIKPNDLFHVADHVARWVSAKKNATSGGQ